MTERGYVEAARAIRAGDVVRALEIYQRLAREGDPYSLVLLAEMHLAGRGVAVDLEKAEELLEQASGLGVKEAVLQKAALARARGDDAKFFVAIREAARSGMLPAEFQLGLCFYRGMGIAQDAALAIAAMETAAARGHVGARMFLGRQLLANPLHLIAFLRGLWLWSSGFVMNLWFALSNPEDDRFR